MQKNILFDKYYKCIDKSKVDEYKYIILEYIFGNFIYIISNEKKYLFIKNNNLGKSIFFKKIFKLNKYFFKINIEIEEKQISFVQYYLNYSNIFFYNYIKNFKFIEYEKLIELLKLFDLIYLDKYNLLFFYYNLIKCDFDKNIYNYDDVKIKYLLPNEFI